MTHSAAAVLAASASPQWREGGTSRNSQQLRYAYNAALRRAPDRAAFPIRVEIIIALRAPFRYGLIDRADLADVGLAGDIIRERSAGRAAIAAVVTAVATRTFLLYTDSPALAQELDRELTARVTDHVVAVRAFDDQRWTAYAQVRKLDRRFIVGGVIVVVLPFLAGAPVLAHFGVGWAIAEVVALYGWIGVLVYAAVRGRKRVAGWDRPVRGTSWLARHPALSFAVCSYMLASLLFFFPAVWLGSVLSPWVCVGISAAIGVGVTAAIWPRQLRYYADIRSRAAVS